MEQRDSYRQTEYIEENGLVAGIAVVILMILSVIAVVSVFAGIL
jgi:hypothetical protein